MDRSPRSNLTAILRSLRCGGGNKFAPARDFPRHRRANREPGASNVAIKLLIPESNTNRTRGANEIAICRDSADALDDLVEWDRDNSRRLERDHRAPSPLEREFHRACTEARGKKPIGAGWRTAPLEVSKDDGACFLVGEAFQVPRDSLADPTEALGSRGRTLAEDGVTCSDRSCSFGGDHDAEPGAESLAREDVLCDGFQVVRDLGMRMTSAPPPTPAWSAIQPA